MSMLVEILRKLGLLDLCLEISRKLGLLRVAYRLYEKTASKRSQALITQTEADGVPIPPPDLIFIVAATSDVECFLRVGRTLFHNISNVLKKNGFEIEACSAILDFGCGCGRVLRHWRGVKGPQFYGVDYNPELIRWCQENLPFAKCSLNTFSPHLVFADETFDCVYAISVFTHLSQELQPLWMKELGRVTRRGGYLLFTTHGECYRHKLTQEERDAFDAGQLVTQFEEASGMNLCCAFHPQAYVRKLLPHGYTIADFIPGTEGVQDLYLIRTG